jgi:hypothetical protein
VEGACQHLLQADGDSDAIFSVLVGLNVPDWPTDISEDSAEPYVDEAFGELRPLIESRTYGSWPDGLRSLMPDAVSRIQAPVAVVSWFCDIPMVSADGTDYYSEQPVRATAELASIVERLRAGFAILDSRLNEAEGRNP